MIPELQQLTEKLHRAQMLARWNELPEEIRRLARENPKAGWWIVKYCENKVSLEEALKEAERISRFSLTI